MIMMEDRWLEGFSPKIGACNALHVEMWGMYLGLDMIWREGVSHLIIQSDLKVLVDMITNKCKTNGNIPTLIQRIQNFLRRDGKHNLFIFDDVKATKVLTG